MEPEEDCGGAGGSRFGVRRLLEFEPEFMSPFCAGSLECLLWPLEEDLLMSARPLAAASNADLHSSPGDPLVLGLLSAKVENITQGQEKREEFFSLHGEVTEWSTP